MKRFSLTSSSPSTWQAVTPSEAGFAADLPDKLEYGLRSGLLRNLHAVLILRKGEIVLERYFEGPDETWGHSLGQVAFQPDTLHDLRSVTKSIVSLLYGIALDQGLVPPPEARVLDHFDRYLDLAEDHRRAELTIAHALTMTLGLEWDELRPYTDTTNSEVAMEHAPDRLRYVLERPFVTEPGTRWAYNGGATAVLGALICQGTGQSLADYARQVLFEPLGIERIEWMSGRDGVHSAASGLRLTLRDLARIGELVNRQGEWEGRRIVPADWIEQSMQSAVETGDGLEYNRQWFLGETTVSAVSDRPQPWMAGFGNGGQRLWIMPSIDTVGAIFSGAYNSFDAWVSPTRIWREIVLANVTKA